MLLRLRRRWRRSGQQQRANLTPSRSVDDDRFRLRRHDDESQARRKRNDKAAVGVRDEGVERQRRWEDGICGGGPIGHLSDAGLNGLQDRPALDGDHGPQDWPGLRDAHESAQRAQR